MNYLVAVLSDRIQAETAYSVLEKAGLPMDKVSILGRGYKSADEYGLLDPNQQAGNRSKLMAVWLVPFGFVAGYCFNLITGLTTFAWAGELGNHIVGGLLGGVAAAMGSFFVGGGAILMISGGDTVPYRDRLSAGKYLVVVNGSETLTRKATEVLRPLEPENLQGYADTSDV